MKMLKFKKILACMSATFLMTNYTHLIFTKALEIETESPDSLSTVYTSADVNRNGVVDLVDCVIINQYLTGLRYVADARLMDVDGNGIVSSADSICVLSEIIENNYVNNVDGSPYSFRSFYTINLYNTPSSASDSHNYYRHVYSGTGIEGTYTLSMQETALPTSISSPDVVIDDDDRYAETDNELKSGICRVSSGGTGFVVGDHLIATAAHVCYTGTSWASNMYVQFPDNNGLVNFNTATKHYATEAHIDNTFYTMRTSSPSHYTSAMVPYDYALITVADDLSDHYHFNLGVSHNIYPLSYPFEDYNLYVTGFPSDLIPNEHSRILYTASGNLLYKNYTDRLCYDTDMYNGDSGAPVYVKESYYTNNDDDETDINTVVGINVAQSSYNSGVILTPLRVKFYVNNSNAHY